jgi:hypothetical protein
MSAITQNLGEINKLKTLVNIPYINPEEYKQSMYYSFGYNLMLVPPEYTIIQKTVDTTFEIEITLINILEKQIIISIPNEVRDYLFRYPDILEILPTVCELTRQRFDLQTQLSLEVYNDPEIEDEYLTLYVRQKKYDNEIMNKIKEIRKNYEKFLIERKGWFLVTTDFRSPR